MTFKEFQEKYKDVRIEEFFPHCNLRYDACIGDIYKSGEDENGVGRYSVYKFAICSDEVFRSRDELVVSKYIVERGYFQSTSFDILDRYYQRKKELFSFNREEYYRSGFAPIDFTRSGFRLVEDGKTYFKVSTEYSTCLDIPEKCFTCYKGGDLKPCFVVGISANMIHTVRIDINSPDYCGGGNLIQREIKHHELFVECKPKEIEIPEYTMEELTKKLGHDFKIKK